MVRIRIDDQQRPLRRSPSSTSCFRLLKRCSPLRTSPTPAVLDWKRKTTPYKDIPIYRRTNHLWGCKFVQDPAAPSSGLAFTFRTKIQSSRRKIQLRWWSSFKMQVFPVRVQRHQVPENWLSPSSTKNAELLDTNTKIGWQGQCFSPRWSNRWDHTGYTTILQLEGTKTTILHWNHQKIN